MNDLNDTTPTDFLHDDKPAETALGARVRIAIGRPAPVKYHQIPSRYDLSRDDLGAILSGQPKYRVDQVWQGLHEQLAEPSDMTALPKSLRAELTEKPEMRSALKPIAESIGDGGNTVKWAFELEGGHRIETVLMHYPDRTTVCISTQAGCAMACGFCATGQGGFQRQLSIGEIVEQVVRARRQAELTGRRLSNVVYMGMGEPLANYGPMWGSVERIHDHLGLSARHITVSTVGVIPGILKLAEEALPVNLAVSLHAANDSLRNELVPLNETYPLEALADACYQYLKLKGRRLSFEWAMIDGVNDKFSDAVELANYARALGAHVNLIPLNPTPGWPTVGSPLRRVQQFRDELEIRKVTATIRHNRGTDIDAACGQLAART
jgi:23S rRNA (adenine2503-C2)-methyltransferase